MEAKPASSTPTIDDSGDIVRLIRELPPAHCILRVDNFSLLQDGLYSFQSTEFTSAGYKWVMHIYPNGNYDEGGQGYISVYVTMVDNLDQSTYVNVALRFFIYDQRRDNYMTVQFVKDKRFSSMKTSWGIPKFVRASYFDNSSNGFLVDDSCFFGAEILVLGHGHLQAPHLSMLHRDKKYTWRIDKFSDLGDKPVYSPTFTFGEWSWKLSMYPNGHKEEEGNHVSVYLELQNGDDLKKGSKLCTKYNISVKNQNSGQSYTRSDMVSWFGSKSLAYGYQGFMPILIVKNYLLNDVMVIEVQIKVMFLLKDMEQ